MDIEAHAMITLPQDETGLPAYLAAKPGEEVRPGIILIHEVWGLTDHIKDVANRLCNEGYEVIAPDLMAHTVLEKVARPELADALFDPENNADKQQELRALFTPLSSPEFASYTVEKLNNCFSYLDKKTYITDIAVVGFCFGGTYSFNLAINQPKLNAAVVFYGHSEHSDSEIAKINCPVLAFYGDQDTNLIEKLPALESQMKNAGKDFKSKVYPGAKHAFFNDTNPLTYNKAAADDSWKLALEFLKDRLK